MIYLRRARLLNVVNGNTVRMLVDLGYRTYQEQSIRLLNVDAPDVYRGSEEVRTQGRAAKQFVQTWFDQHGRMQCGTNQTWTFTVDSQKSASFGRFLGTVCCVAGHSLNDDILQSGLVKLYEQKES